MKLYLILLFCILGAAATCEKASYCDPTLCACNGACYSEDQYCCPNGQLTQKAFCASTPAATSSATPAATSSSATCQKASYCDATHCACNGACYSEDQYCCSNGQLTQKAFCPSSAATSSAAAAATSSAAAATSAASAADSTSVPCQPYSIVPIASCADSNPAKDYYCCTGNGYGMSNGSFCGGRHQCYNGYCGLTGRLGENCPASTSSSASSDSSSTTCQTSSYCPSTLCACNGACYSEDQYCCSNGQLTQKSFCSTSSGSASSATSNAVVYSQYMAADTTDVSTLTLINNCDVTISLCSTYGGPLFSLTAGQNATNQPSGPYNECGSVQAEVTLTASNSQSCYDLSEVAYKQNKHPITLYSSNGNTLTCQTSPCSDATQQGGSPQVKCVAAPTNIVIQWC